jgi:hypothetical protein
MFEKLTKLVLLSVTLWSFCGCSHDKAPAEPEIPVGKPAYSFDWKKTNSLTIAKADPATGDHWMARVGRIQEKPESFFENDPWEIQAYSENTVLSDRLANRILIEHFLDTLSTFRAETAVDADESSDKVRSSYGLNPPRYSIQWQAWDLPSQKMRTYQVEISPETTTQAGHETYGSFPPSRKIYKVEGATIPMLGYIKDFLTLRQSQLSPLSSDDVDEIVVEGGGGKLYAQRDGDRWADEKHHPWKKEFGPFLDRLTHLRIKNFIDSENEAVPLKQKIERSTTMKVTVKDRYGKPTVFRFARMADHRVVADVSSRGQAVFELFPDALDHFNP